MNVRGHLRAGQVIPALPLALDRKRQWDERHQRALIRYYLDAGTGGLAVGVHSTQFAIRDPHIGLYEPVLRLAAETADAWLGKKSKAWIRIAGICGRTAQAVKEARTARSLGYAAGLLSMAAWKIEPEPAILRHCRRVAKEIPIIGFYLQSSVGGRAFSYRFWQEFADIPELVAVKIAPFNRYQTIDVVRAVVSAGREDVALYTGNDDNIISDLMTPFTFGNRTRYIDGGLLGQWGVWTLRAVAIFRQIQKTRFKTSVSRDWLRLNAALTDINAAIFDPAHGFAGCIPGIHEVLRRQGLLSTIACLDPDESLSPGQAREISRVAKMHPLFVDDDFVARNLDRWLE
jgi:dihydrodipicolinate synthase/N-acetylneuraminate lyase